jgi:hypothetical protein
MVPLTLRKIIMKTPEILEIVNGPNRKQLWLQTPKIDDWVASKSITQLPVQFQIGTKFSQKPFLIYLEEIMTMENSTNAIMFYGQTIDPISGDRMLVEGQYDYKELTGIAWVKSLEDAYSEKE